MAISWPWQRKPGPPPTEAADGGADTHAEPVQRAEAPAPAPASPAPVSEAAPETPSVDVAFVPARRAAPASNAGRDALAEMGAGMGDSSGMLVLGNRGGLNETAVFLKESLETSDRVRASDFSDMVMRSFDDGGDGGAGDFAGSLTSLLSFSDPQSIIDGSRMERPFGKRVERTAETAPAEASPLAALRPFEAMDTTRPTDPRRMGYSGALAGLTPFQPVTPEPALPVDAARNAPRTMRKLADALSHESASAPASPAEPFVARSVPAGTELPTLPAGSGRVDRAGSGTGASGASSSSELPTFAGVRSPRPTDRTSRVERSVDAGGRTETSSTPSQPASTGERASPPAAARVTDDGVPSHAGQVTLTEPFRARPPRVPQEPARDGEAAGTLQRHAAVEAGPEVPAEPRQDAGTGELPVNRIPVAPELATVRSEDSAPAVPTDAGERTMTDSALLELRDTHHAVPTDTGEPPMSEAAMDLPLRSATAPEAPATDPGLQRTARVEEPGRAEARDDTAVGAIPPADTPAAIVRATEATMSSAGDPSSERVPDGGSDQPSVASGGDVGSAVAEERLAVLPDGGSDQPTAASSTDAGSAAVEDRLVVPEPSMPGAPVARLVDDGGADSPVAADDPGATAHRVEPTVSDPGTESGPLEMPLARAGGSAGPETPASPARPASITESVTERAPTVSPPASGPAVAVPAASASEGMAAARPSSAPAAGSGVVTRSADTGPASEAAPIEAANTGGRIERTPETAVVAEPQAPGGSGETVARASEASAAEPFAPQSAGHDADGDADAGDGDDLHAGHAHTEAAAAEEDTAAPVVARLVAASDVVSSGERDTEPGMATADELVAERRVTPIAGPDAADGFAPLDMAFRESAMADSGAEADSAPGPGAVSRSPDIESIVEAPTYVATPTVGMAPVVARTADEAGPTSAVPQGGDDRPAPAEQREDASNTRSGDSGPTVAALAANSGDAAIGAARPGIARAVVFPIESPTDGGPAEPLSMPMVRAGGPSGQEGAQVPGAVPASVARRADADAVAGSEAGSTATRRVTPDGGVADAPGAAATLRRTVDAPPVVASAPGNAPAPDATRGTAEVPPGVVRSSSPDAPTRPGNPAPADRTGRTDSASPQPAVQRHGDASAASEEPGARVIDDGNPSTLPELTWRTGDGPATAARFSAPDMASPRIGEKSVSLGVAGDTVMRTADAPARSTSPSGGEPASREAVMRTADAPTASVPSIGGEPASREAVTSGEVAMDLASGTGFGTPVAPGATGLDAPDAGSTGSPADVERPELAMDFIARRADTSSPAADAAGERPGSASLPESATEKASRGGQAPVSPIVSRAVDATTSPALPFAAAGPRADRQSDAARMVADPGNPVQRRGDTLPAAVQGAADRTRGDAPSRVTPSATPGLPGTPAGERGAPLVYRSVAAGESVSRPFESETTGASHADGGTGGIGPAPAPETDAWQTGQPGRVSETSSTFVPGPTGTFAVGNARSEATSARQASSAVLPTFAQPAGPKSESRGSAGPVQRTPAAAAASARGAIMRDAERFEPAMAEMTLVTPPAARDSGAAEQALRRTPGHAAPLEMPLVAPVVARAVDDSLDDRPQGVEAFGRVSRAITVDDVQTTAPAESPGGGTEPNLDVLTERVWERIRRKLRIERERTRGVL